MGSFIQLGAVALTTTCVAWSACLVALIIGLRRGRRQACALIGGLIGATTGAMLDQIAHQAAWPHDVTLAVDGLAGLLTLGGVVIILAAAAKGPERKALPRRR